MSGVGRWGVEQRRELLRDADCKTAEVRADPLGCGWGMCTRGASLGPRWKAEKRGGGGDERSTGDLASF